MCRKLNNKVKWSGIIQFHSRCTLRKLKKKKSRKVREKKKKPVTLRNPCAHREGISDVAVRVSLEYKTMLHVNGLRAGVVKALVIPLFLRRMRLLSWWYFLYLEDSFFNLASNTALSCSL